MSSRFGRALLRAIEDTEKVPLYAGTEPHRFTGIWMVVADGRVYVRSWKIRGERSWHEDLARHRIGAIILDRHEITIESQPIESRHALAPIRQ